MLLDYPAFDKRKAWCISVLITKLLKLGFICLTRKFFLKMFCHFIDFFFYHFSLLKYIGRMCLPDLHLRNPEVKVSLAYNINWKDITKATQVNSLISTGFLVLAPINWIICRVHMVEYMQKFTWLSIILTLLLLVANLANIK